MAEIEFKNNFLQAKEVIAEKAVAFLHEATAEIEAETIRNSRTDTGKTKGDWETEVDDDTLTGYVGNPNENAIWEEYGTGEYAVNGDGRQTSWRYQDAKGNWYTTTGKTPNRPLERAYESKKDAIQEMAKSKLSEVNDSD